MLGSVSFPNFRDTCRWPVPSVARRSGPLRTVRSPRPQPGTAGPGGAGDLPNEPKRRAWPAWTKRSRAPRPPRDWRHEPRRRWRAAALRNEPERRRKRPVAPPRRPPPPGDRAGAQTTKGTRAPRRPRDWRHEPRRRWRGAALRNEPERRRKRRWRLRGGRHPRRPGRRADDERNPSAAATAGLATRAEAAMACGSAARRARAGRPARDVRDEPKRQPCGAALRNEPEKSLMLNDLLADIWWRGCRSVRAPRPCCTGVRAPVGRCVGTAWAIALPSRAVGLWLDHGVPKPEAPRGRRSPPIPAALPRDGTGRGARVRP
jgi:hypothetical protein